MSQWHPNDLVADGDLTAYESDILTQFGMSSWIAKRTKALEDWLIPLVESQGFAWQRFRTRYEAETIFGYTSAVYTEYTSESKSTTVDDVPLGTVLASTSDYLYIGSVAPFRGLSFRVLDSPSTATSTATVQYWGDAWTSLAVSDGTAKSTGKSFSGGGAITWSMPNDWTQRAVNSSNRLYWVRVSVSAALTSSTKTNQVGVIRRSRLCGPATHKTLEWIFREAPTGGEGPWIEKAEYYREQAAESWSRVQGLIGGEFEAVDSESDLIDSAESVQTAAQASDGGWTWERY